MRKNEEREAQVREGRGRWGRVKRTVIIRLIILLIIVQIQKNLIKHTYICVAKTQILLLTRLILWIIKLSK